MLSSKRSTLVWSLSANGVTCPKSWRVGCSVEEAFVTKWSHDELTRFRRSLAEYSEELVRNLIEEAKNSETAEQLTMFLDDLCHGVCGDAQFGFFPLACCVALSESSHIGAVDTLFDMARTELPPALETAATQALQRLGAPAMFRVLELIKDCEDPFARSFGYTVLQAAVDLDEASRQTIVDFCLERAKTEGRAPKEREWGCWPALSACAALVAMEQQAVRSTIEWWMQQQSDVERVHWNELLIQLDGCCSASKTFPWREPWPRRCRRLAQEFQQERSVHATGVTLPSTNQSARREDPKAGRNAPCPCGSNKKYKRCCLK